MPQPDRPEIGARAWASMALRMAAFPLALIWPAGTWQWWEAWAVVAIWFAYAIAVIAFLWRHDPALLAERMKARPSGQKSWDKLLAFPLFAAGVFIFIVPGLDVMRFGWSAPFPPWLEVAAMLIHLPALVFIVWVMRENTYLSRVVKIDEARGHHVITTGPYALVRHPMYSAVIVLMFAVPVALGSRFALIPAAITVALLILRTRLEDRTLHTELPGYPDYARKTRYRLLPGVW